MLDDLAQASLGSSSISAALKAVLAVWLIALMVWLPPSARSAAVLIVALLMYVVAGCELSHIIAGSVEAAYVVLRGNAAIQDYLLRFSHSRCLAMLKVGLPSWGC